MNKSWWHMCRICFHLFGLLIFCLLISEHVEASPPKINIFSLMNGKGLELDQKILAQALEELGYDVQCKSFYDSADGVSYADINIFFEVLNPDWFSYAHSNWFIPNPEWYIQNLKLLKQVDLILCRTREVERIFRRLNKNTYFLGFTSFDCYHEGKITTLDHMLPCLE